MGHLYLVRHAHAQWEPDEARPLSEQGRLDAQRVAQLMDSSDTAGIYSSPARRALETVRPLADRKGLPVVPLSELRERQLPEQAPEDFRPAVEASWRRPDVGLGGGEPNNVAQARGLRALRHMLSRHPGETIVAATHGNLLALLLNGLDASFGFEFWRRMTFPDVYELRFEDGALNGARRLWRGAGDDLEEST